MFRHYNERRRHSRRLRRPPSMARPSGMTLLELLIAMSIMVMVVGTLGALARGVQQSFEYTEGHGEATQHARVVLERIARTVSEATANEQFPGVIVLAATELSWRFPDTLVVWHPTGEPADPQGLPRYNELVIYCPHGSMPNQLVEITAPGDTRTVPPVENTAQWRTEIEAIKNSSSSSSIMLTELMRTCSVSEDINSQWRGAVRFETRLRPSASQWDAYQGGSLDWAELPWVQGIYGSRTGMRQVWVRTELQLMPGANATATSRAAQRAVPFLGSAALYYELHR